MKFFKKIIFILIISILFLDMNCFIYESRASSNNSDTVYKKELDRAPNIKFFTNNRDYLTIQINDNLGINNVEIFEGKKYDKKKKKWNYSKALSYNKNNKTKINSKDISLIGPKKIKKKIGKNKYKTTYIITIKIKSDFFIKKQNNKTTYKKRLLIKTTDSDKLNNGMSGIYTITKLKKSQDGNWFKTNTCPSISIKGTTKFDTKKKTFQSTKLNISDGSKIKSLKIIDLFSNTTKINSEKNIGIEKKSVKGHSKISININLLKYKEKNNYYKLKIIAIDNTGLIKTEVIYIKAVAKKSNINNYLFLGDSRTVQMRRAVLKNPSLTKNINIKWYGKIKSGYMDWFDKKDDLVSKERKKALINDINIANKNNNKTKVIIWLGVNDLKNINKYISKVNSLSSTYKNVHFYYLSVTPTMNNKKNVTIKSFNKKLKNNLNTKSNNLDYKNIYPFVNNTINEDSCPDGTHYTPELYLKIFKRMMSLTN